MIQAKDAAAELWDKNTALHILSQKIDRGESFAIALCDIDFFINIDMKIGSSEGDAVLTRIGAFFAAQSACRVGQYGSDSFLLMFDNCTTDYAFTLTEQIRRSLRKQRLLPQNSVYAKVPVTASFGLTNCIEGNPKLPLLLRQGEIALAAAKKKGRNRTEYYANAEMKISLRPSPGVFTLTGGLNGYSGDSGAVQNAEISQPYGLDITQTGELLLADRGNHAIRKVDRSGIITTLAGTGTYGYSGDGGTAKNAQLNKPSGAAVGPDGSIYIADTGNHCIRKISPQGQIETYAGCGTAGYSGDGKYRTLAQLNRPGGVAVDRNGNVYTNDYGNNVIRMIRTDGLIYTVAGSGAFGYAGDGGSPLNASMNRPYGLAVSPDGQHIYIADYGNHCIREADRAADVMRTICGSGTPGYTGDEGTATNARLNGPFWVTLWRNNILLIADGENHCIRMMNLTTNTICTLTGCGIPGYIDTPVSLHNAKYNIPAGMAVDGKKRLLYIADYANNAIRACSISNMF